MTVDTSSFVDVGDDVSAAMGTGAGSASLSSKRVHMVSMNSYAKANEQLTEAIEQSDRYGRQIEKLGQQIEEAEYERNLLITRLAYLTRFVQEHAADIVTSVSNSALSRISTADVKAKLVQFDGGAAGSSIGEQLAESYASLAHYDYGSDDENDYENENDTNTTQADDRMKNGPYITMDSITQCQHDLVPLPFGLPPGNLNYPIPEQAVMQQHHQPQPQQPPASQNQPGSMQQAQYTPQLRAGGQMPSPADLSAEQKSAGASTSTKLSRSRVITMRGPRSVQPVDRNADGTYILPVMIGVIKVLSLGEVVFDRPSYHSDRYIYPAGYSIQRLFGSMITPDKHVLYTCTILDGGNQPLFRVVAEDCPDKPIEWASATGAWSKVVRQVNAVRKKEASNSISGPDLFGLTHATIAKMIQDLPNVEKCPNYVPQNFIAMDPKHVKAQVSHAATTAKAVSFGGSDENSIVAAAAGRKRRRGSGSGQQQEQQEQEQQEQQEQQQQPEQQQQEQEQEQQEQQQQQEQRAGEIPADQAENTAMYNGVDGYLESETGQEDDAMDDSIDYD